MSKFTIPALLAGSYLAVSTAMSLAHAGEEEQQGSSMQEHSAIAETAIKDAWLDGKLESALLFNEHLNSFDIDTDVENGVATLSGAVESDIDRDLAGEIAESIDGVTKVRNRLVVDETKARNADGGEEGKARRGFRNAVANATLTARIKSELLVNSNTPGLSINVDSSDEEVILSGKVKSEQEKALAEKIAQNASDGRDVDNRLIVSNDS